MKTNNQGLGGLSKSFFRDLSAPNDIPAKKVKLLLEERISLGEIEIGESIVEREYNKLVTNDGGSVVKHTFSVNGENILYLSSV